jgi:hypothetical protein
MEQQRPLSAGNFDRRPAISMLKDIPCDSRHVISDPRNDHQIQIETVDLLVHHIEHDDRACAGIPHLRCQLMLRIRGITGHHDASGLHNAEICNDRLRRVRQTNSHTVAFTNTPRHKATGEPVNDGAQFLIRERFPEEIEGRPARKPLHA